MTLSILAVKNKGKMQQYLKEGMGWKTDTLFVPCFLTFSFTLTKNILIPSPAIALRHCISYVQT